MGRQEGQGVDLVLGALGLGIKGTNRVDLIIEKVDPIGSRAPHGVEIENRAAGREFTMLHHLGGGVVARLLQAIAQGMQLHLLPFFQQQGKLLQKAFGEQAHHQGRDRDNQ